VPSAITGAGNPDRNGVGAPPPGGIDTTTGVQTADNWWAAVLSRDPAINCYMIAHALTYFNHDATRRWIGCYYAEPCWGNESNRLGDVLKAWPALRRAAHL